MSDNAERNVVFFGRTGCGKSSIINLLNPEAKAPTSRDSTPCTQTKTSYKTTLKGQTFNLWDTRGLDEAQGGFFNFKKTPEKELGEFRKGKDRPDLLVYCVSGVGAFAAEKAMEYYKSFALPLLPSDAPVVIVVSWLEKEVDMEKWWESNAVKTGELQTAFVGHACISTHPKDDRLDDSKENLITLISGNCRSPFSLRIQTSGGPSSGYNDGLGLASPCTPITNAKRRWPRVTNHK